MTKEKLYRCRYCRQRVKLSELRITMPYVCKGCISEHYEANKDKLLRRAKTDVKRKERARLRKKKESLMTLSDWLKIAQAHFNRYIRERDKDKPCISCGEYRKTNDAGHYFSVGNYPALRFNEKNCHLQCVYCNRHLHGNLTEYEPRLRALIGDKEMERLYNERNKPKHYTIPEVKFLIETYKQKLKDLKEQNKK